MISSVTGKLREVQDDRALLEVGPMVLELLVPASDIATLRADLNRGRPGADDSASETTITFHTIFYLEGDSSGGNSEPKLLGFRSTQDKRFFEKFITVKGIGPRKALRALTQPAGQIAEAIEHRDANSLSQLPGIGKRTAEQVIAELCGKVQEFVGVRRTGPGGLPEGQAPPGFADRQARTPIEEDAILSLMALGERRGDAETLLERAKSSLGGGIESQALVTTDALLRTMLRLRTSR